MNIRCLGEIGRHVNVENLLIKIDACLFRFKGLQMLGKIRRTRIPVVRGAQQVRAVGDDRLASVRFTRGGKVQSLAADLLLLHEGVVPNTQLSRAIGCRHEWYAPHRYWRPVVDVWGRSSVPGRSLVGDGTGIYGAKIAEYAGFISGADAAYQLGRWTRSHRDRYAAPFIARRRRETAFRPFIDRLYPPAKEMTLPQTRDTIVCRCEEATSGDIDDAIARGYRQMNTIKNERRSGMGRCQGRMCSPTVAEILADRLQVSPQTIGQTRIRPPIKPVTLEQLASMQSSGSGPA